MLNKVQIIGRLGRDPELRYSQSGSPVCTLSVATDEGYTDRDGKKVDRTEWHRVVLYSKAAENCNQFLKKGSLVLWRAACKLANGKTSRGKTVSPRRSRRSASSSSTRRTEESPVHLNLTAWTMCPSRR